MKAKKGQAGIKKSDQEIERKLLLLHEWTQIIQSLYPHKSTQNPYQNHLTQLTEHLTIKEQLLHQSLVHSITLMNKHSRMNERGELISTESDNLNALYLLLPPEAQLTPKNLTIYSTLKATYQDQPFTYVEASSRLKLSHSTVKRLLRPLLLYGMIEKARSQDSTKTQLRVIDTTQDQSEEFFAEAQGEWKEFRGFVAF
ncbi:MAG: hypothetical protein JXR03_20550 [Cyclobacteriaceae bacterium]